MKDNHLWNSKQFKVRQQFLNIHSSIPGEVNSFKSLPKTPIKMLKITLTLRVINKDEFYCPNLSKNKRLITNEESRNKRFHQADYEANILNRV